MNGLEIMFLVWVYSFCFIIDGVYDFGEKEFDNEKLAYVIFLFLVFVSAPTIVGIGTYKQLRKTK